MRVAASFDRASDYDRHALVQRIVARKLADRIGAQRLVAAPNVLEIGCGTGLLGASLIDRLPRSRWLMTDVSPGMLDRAQNRFAARSDVRYACMDGERPFHVERFDLICSSLAFQWFTDLPPAVARLRGLLAPGGLLAFSTLLAGSFKEWRRAHGDLPCGSHDYPDTAALRRAGVDVQAEEHVTHHRDCRDFLTGLKAIGAGTPRSGHRPLSSAQLRTVMKRFEQCGATATYIVGFCTVRDPAPAAASPWRQIEPQQVLPDTVDEFTSCSAA